MSRPDATDATGRSRPLLVVAGEASGDLHGARLLEALAEERRDLAPFGLGGDRMERAGLELLADVAEISVVGLSEVLRVWSRAKAIFDRLLAEVELRRPEMAILIDFPEFNLRLAKALDERGVRVVYYISPQVWAWRRGRVRTIARHVEAMLVLFPFEVEFYRRHGIEAVHVGHPLVDEVPAPEQIWDRQEEPEGPYRIALLPGSRTSEVEKLLPTMLATVGRLAEEIPVQAVLVQAPTIRRERLEELALGAGVTVEVVREGRFEAIAGSHFALCASGTATLEVGLLTTPLAVLYRLGTWTYLMAKALVRLPHVSLVNLVLDRRAVPELIQSEARPERIADEVLAVLADGVRRREMREALAELRPLLGDGGASRRAAAEVVRRLERARQSA